MPRLAIVIPCPGDAPLFEDTLVSVLQHRPADCQVLVVHAEPYADPYDLSSEVTFLHASGETRLPALINQAIAAARAEIVHVVGCGVQATDGWVEPALRHFADQQVASVAPLLTSASAPARMICAGVGWTWGGGEETVGAGIERTRAARLAPRIIGPHWRAAFYRREVVLALGGLDETLTAEAAELDLALSLRGLDYTVESETGSTLLAPTDRLSIPAENLERLYWRHREAGDWADLLLAHPLRCLSHAVQHGAGALAGRVSGALSHAARAAQQARLELAREQLEAAPVVIPFPTTNEKPFVSKSQRKAA